MEKNTKVVLSAVLILLISMFSFYLFDLNIITGKITSQECLQNCAQGVRPDSSTFNPRAGRLGQMALIDCNNQCTSQPTSSTRTSSAQVSSTATPNCDPCFVRCAQGVNLDGAKFPLRTLNINICRNECTSKGCPTQIISESLSSTTNQLGCGDNICSQIETCTTCGLDCGSCAYGVPGPSTGTICGYKEEKLKHLLTGTTLSSKKRLQLKYTLSISYPEIMKTKINEWVFSDPVLYHETKNNKYDNAVKKIAQGIKETYSGNEKNDPNYIVTNCDLSGHPSYALLTGGRGNCVDWAALSLSLIRTLGVPQERVFSVLYPTIKGLRNFHATTVYVSDNNQKWIIDYGTIYPSGNVGALPYGCGYHDLTKVSWGNDYGANWGLNGVTCEAPQQQLTSCEQCRNNCNQGINLGDTTPTFQPFGAALETCQNACQQTVCPIGFLDSADCNQITGWACVPDDPNNQLPVGIRYNRDKGKEIGIGETIAGQQREQAVAERCRGNPNHGFTISTPSFIKDGQFQEISAYLYIPQGEIELSGSPKTIRCN